MRISGAKPPETLENFYVAHYENYWKFIIFPFFLLSGSVTSKKLGSGSVRFQTLGSGSVRVRFGTEPGL